MPDSVVFELQLLIFLSNFRNFFTKPFSIYIPMLQANHFLIANRVLSPVHLVPSIATAQRWGSRFVVWRASACAERMPLKIGANICIYSSVPHLSGGNSLVAPRREVGALRNRGEVLAWNVLSRLPSPVVRRCHVTVSINAYSWVWCGASAGASRPKGRRGRNFRGEVLTIPNAFVMSEFNSFVNFVFQFVLTTYS